MEKSRSVIRCLKAFQLDTALVLPIDHCEIQILLRFALVNALLDIKRLKGAESLVYLDSQTWSRTFYAGSPGRWFLSST
jgi:hypothetical protein